MELSVHTQDGKDTGRTVSFPENLLMREARSNHVLYLEIKRYLAAQRQGTHKSKERGEIEGSTRKLKKQKGTGTARSGSIKSPIFRGGGTVFGPRPRDYTLRLSKKVRRLARKLALSEKFNEQSITLVEKVSFEVCKTKQYLTFLKNLQVDTQKTLFVTAEDSSTELRKSSNNLPQASVLAARYLNAYAILSHSHLILEEDSLPQLQQLWS